MRAFVFLLLVTISLGLDPAPSIASACQLQNVRTGENLLICIYNCNGKIVTLTRTGGVCPVILE